MLSPQESPNAVKTQEELAVCCCAPPFTLSFFKSFCQAWISALATWIRRAAFLAILLCWTCAPFSAHAYGADRHVASIQTDGSSRKKKKGNIFFGSRLKLDTIFLFCVLVGLVLG
jgi:hypothetical protein